MLLSLFSGAGGMDLGFEDAQFGIPLAYDLKPDSIASYNHNRGDRQNGRVADVRELTLSKLDSDFGGQFSPVGIIGGPPCQSFSKANRSTYDPADPRHQLPLEYARVAGELNNRNPVHYVVFENVTCFAEEKHEASYNAFKLEMDRAGFILFAAKLNAEHYDVPQKRTRLIVVGVNRTLYQGQEWRPPEPDGQSCSTVGETIGQLAPPAFFRKDIKPTNIPVHPNHWCMNPKSPRFHTPGALRPGDSCKRSFKVLDWNAPSLTVAYGNREVHVHPNCKRRLSVYEAMLLQGFPKTYQLLGSLSSQIDQVSEAVPPPLAKAVAESITDQIAQPVNPKTTRLRRKKAA